MSRLGAHKKIKIKLKENSIYVVSHSTSWGCQSVIQPIFPYKLDKIVKPVKVEHGWIIFRGEFFGDYVGLVFTTDKKGKITLVDYILRINPEDYSYKASQE